MGKSDLGDIARAVGSVLVRGTKFATYRASHFLDQGLYIFLPEENWFVSPVENLDKKQKRRMFYNVGSRGDLSYQVKAACEELGIPYTNTKKQKKLLNELAHAQKIRVMLNAGKAHPTRDLEREAFEMLSDEKIAKEQSKKKNPHGTLGYNWMRKHRRANFFLHQAIVMLAVGIPVVVPWNMYKESLRYNETLTKIVSNLKPKAIAPTKSTFYLDRNEAPDKHLFWKQDENDGKFQSHYHESDITTIIEQSKGKRVFPNVDEKSLDPYQARIAERKYGIDIKWENIGGKYTSYISFNNRGKWKNTKFKIENQNGELYFPEVAKGSATPIEALQIMQSNPDFKIYFEKEGNQYVSMAPPTRGDHPRKVERTEKGFLSTEIKGKKL